MEPQKEGTNEVKESEEDSSRCSSASSASAESAVSDFSFDEHGRSAHEHEHEHEQLEKGSLQPGTLGSDVSLESPPAQVMERSPDSSRYRIPSYVFARNKSNTPNPDWSTTSNESLFSIHTGNMSFTRDQFSFLTKSGELGAYGPGDLRKSGEFPPLSPMDMNKSGEMLTTTPDEQKSEEQIIAANFNASPPSSPSVTKVASSPRVSEVSAADLAISAKKDDTKKATKPSMDETPFSTSVASHRSNASGQSFAFPVLTDVDRQKSVNSVASRVDLQKEATTPKTSKLSVVPVLHSSSWLSCFSSCCSCWTSKQS